MRGKLCKNEMKIKAFSATTMHHGFAAAAQFVAVCLSTQSERVSAIGTSPSGVFTLVIRLVRCATSLERQALGLRGHEEHASLAEEFLQRK